MAEFVLGSVQLGLDYGVANRTGKPSRAAALALVRRAADCGIRQFDTAHAYGDAEERLGEALSGRPVFTVTKLSPLSELAEDATPADVVAAVEASVAQSCAALRKDRLDCLLLHRAAHMTAFNGVIWQRLMEFVAAGTIRRLGVSVQSPVEAAAALASPAVQHIQMPFNLLDWRWREAGIIAVEVVRNVRDFAKDLDRIDAFNHRPHCRIAGRQEALQENRAGMHDHIGARRQLVDESGFAPTPVEQIERHLDVLHGGTGERGGGFRRRLHRHTEAADGSGADKFHQPLPDHAIESGHMRGTMQ